MMLIYRELGCSKGINGAHSIVISQCFTSAWLVVMVLLPYLEVMIQFENQNSITIEEKKESSMVRILILASRI